MSLRLFPDSSATVQITYDAAPTLANAGAPQPGTTTFSDTHAGSATATVTVAGVYVFTWTIHNGTCPDSSATVQITYDAAPTLANAGAPQDVCALVATLTGNTPAVGFICKFDYGASRTAAHFNITTAQVDGLWRMKSITTDGASSLIASRLSAPRSLNPPCHGFSRDIGDVLRILSVTSLPF